MNNGRIIVWFSCGAASAAASAAASIKASEKYKNDNLEICYCDTLKYEHPDNIRFMQDVSKCVGLEIKILKSNKYADIYDTFEKTGYIAGISGASCTRCLKRDVRKDYQEDSDVHIFGFTFDEEKRLNNFKTNNPDLHLEFLLYDLQITKKDCYQILRDNNIEIPTMYKMGYKNNNCIGCVKGGAGYWNKIKIDFPEYFNKMAEFTRKKNVRLVKNKGKRIFLDELPEGVGNYKSEPDFECGVGCKAPELIIK